MAVTAAAAQPQPQRSSILLHRPRAPWTRLRTPCASAGTATGDQRATLNALVAATTRATATAHATRLRASARASCDGAASTTLSTAHAAAAAVTTMMMTASNARVVHLTTRIPTTTCRSSTRPPRHRTAQAARCVLTAGSGMTALLHRQSCWLGASRLLPWMATATL